MKLFIKRRKDVVERNLFGEEVRVSYSYCICKKVFGIFTEYLQIEADWRRKTVVQNGNAVCGWTSDEEYAAELVEEEALALLDAIQQCPNKFVLKIL